MQFDGVIFDLDGTLADTLEDIADAMNRVLAFEGVAEHTPREYRLLVGHGIRNLVAESLPPERRDQATVSRCHAAMISSYGENPVVKTRLYEGAAELVARLRAQGVRLAVFSNKSEDLTRAIVERLLDLGHFEEVVGARPDRPLKPDPSVALRIGERLGLAPGQIAYLGDSRVDMLTATAAGMLAVGAAWGFRTREELIESGALVVIERPLELLELRERR